MKDTNKGIELSRLSYSWYIFIIWRYYDRRYISGDTPSGSIITQPSCQVLAILQCCNMNSQERLGSGSVDILEQLWHGQNRSAPGGNLLAGR